VRLQLRLQAVLACVVQSGNSRRGKGGKDDESGQAVHGGGGGGGVYVMITANMMVLILMVSMVLQAGVYTRRQMSEVGISLRKATSNATVKQARMSCDRTYPYSQIESIKQLLPAIRRTSSPDPQTHSRLPWCNEEDGIRYSNFFSWQGIVIGIGNAVIRPLQRPQWHM